MPSWAGAIDERIKKVARAQSKLSLRLDELMQMLRERLPEASQAQTPTPHEPDPGPVLDALDRLDEAQRVTSVEHPAVAQGLASIGARLEGFLGAMGIERRAQPGGAVNPQLFRVVGVEASEEVEDGMVTRVIRAAVVRGDRLIREGEVLVGRRSS